MIDKAICNSIVIRLATSFFIPTKSADVLHACKGFLGIGASTAIGLKNFRVDLYFYL
jgi:hypothetical protein